MPHFAAAYNLARWLTGNDSDAEDVTQEACVRAIRFFSSFVEGNARAWFLTIVRHTCYTWMRQHRRPHSVISFSDECDTDLSSELRAERSDRDDPAKLLLAATNRKELNDALGELPLGFKEVLILREVEDCSYKEIATIMEIPVGTVMSRLARARRMLQRAFLARSARENQHEM